MRADPDSLSLPQSEVWDIVDVASLDETWEEMRTLRDQPLPAAIQPIVERYREMRGSRDVFIWKWVHELNPHFTFPIVPPDHADRVRNLKTVGTLFVTLLDDVLEKEHDLATFRQASKAPFPGREPEPHRDGVDAEYVGFTTDVWEWIDDQLRSGHDYGRYIDFLQYDLKYTLGAIEYSHLVTESPATTGIEEHVQREAHNMMMYPYLNIDLMFASDVRPDHVSVLRQAVYHAQRMARIGNWISTWRRELGEGDFSAGPIVYAVDQGIVSRDDLRRIDEAGSEALIESVADQIERAGIESYFLDRWQDHYEDLVAIRDDFRPVDLTPFVEGMCQVLRYHVASTGLK